MSQADPDHRDLCGNCFILPESVFFQSTQLTSWSGATHSPSGYLYSAYVVQSAALANNISCTTISTEISVQPPFYATGASANDAEWRDGLDSSFLSHLQISSCALRDSYSGDIITPQAHSPSSVPSSLAILRSALLNQPTATLSSSTTLSSQPSRHSQRASTSTGETTKLIIGLAVAIAVLLLLITVGLATYCLRRKHQRRKDKVATIAETNQEGRGPLLYLQQKVELDDEQRRHEMDATESIYELDGEHEIRGIPGQERDACSDRQQLREEEHAAEVDNTS